MARVRATTQDHHQPRGPATPAARDGQRRAALARANAVRTARAALRRAVHDGTCRVADVVADPPPEARSMPVGELLAAQHRWGESRALRTLRRVPVPEGKAVGALTARQRTALADLLGGSEPAGRAEPEGGPASRDRPGPAPGRPATLRPGTTGRRYAA